MTMYIAKANKHSNKQEPHLLEPCAHLYVGNYVADSLDLTVIQHRALRHLLLETWVRGYARFAWRVWSVDGTGQAKPYAQPSPWMTFCTQRQR
jgi:hypothetical protein